MSVLEIVRWCFAGLLGLLSVYIIGLNFFCVYLGLVRKGHHSLIPLIGGIAGLLALLICPVASFHMLVWPPLVLDLGCVFSVCSFLYAVIVLKALK